MNIESPYARNSRNGKVLIGLVLLIIGAIYLLRDLDIFFFPYWLFRWPMFLILAGLYTGAKHNFRKPTWLFMVLLGVLFLVEPYIYIPIWPIIIILTGVFMIFRRNHGSAQQVTWDARTDASQPNNVFDTQSNVNEPMADEYTKEKAASTSQSSYTGDDFINVTSIFSGIKRTVLSKNFRGGDIVTVFGGSEIDLTQADINGRVILDITQLFGATKLVVPPHWQVVSELGAVFSGVDDKRRVFGAVQQAPDKILVLRGTSIMAGVDIRTY